MRQVGDGGGLSSANLALLDKPIDQDTQAVSQLEPNWIAVRVTD